MGNVCSVYFAIILIYGIFAQDLEPTAVLDLLPRWLLYITAILPTLHNVGDCGNFAVYVSVTCGVGLKSYIK